MREAIRNLCHSYDELTNDVLTNTEYIYFFNLAMYRLWLNFLCYHSGKYFSKVFSTLFTTGRNVNALSH